jgi:hypothetical protein
VLSPGILSRLLGIPVWQSWLTAVVGGLTGALLCEAYAYAVWRLRHRHGHGGGPAGGGGAAGPAGA